MTIYFKFAVVFHYLFYLSFVFCLYYFFQVLFRRLDAAVGCVVSCATALSVEQ